MTAELGVSLIHRRPSLLSLQEQRVGTGPALQQDQIDPHPHAAYPHHLADHVDRGEPVEQAPPVLWEGKPVSGEEVVDDFGLLAVADRDANRGILGYPGPPVRHRGEFGERAPAGAAPALLLDVDRNLVA